MRGRMQDLDVEFNMKNLLGGDDDDVNLGIQLLTRQSFLMTLIYPVEFRNLI